LSHITGSLQESCRFFLSHFIHLFNKCISQIALIYPIKNVYDQLSRKAIWELSINFKESLTESVSWVLRKLFRFIESIKSTLIGKNIWIISQNPSLLVFFQSSLNSCSKKAENVSTIAESPSKYENPQESAFLSFEKQFDSVPVRKMIIVFLVPLIFNYHFHSSSLRLNDT
jgi:hypothetical protein